MDDKTFLNGIAEGIKNNTYGAEQAGVQDVWKRLQAIANTIPDGQLTMVPVSTPHKVARMRSRPQRHFKDGE
jgi:hypothetical protein